MSNSVYLNIIKFDNKKYILKFFNFYLNDLNINKQYYEIFKNIKFINNEKELEKFFINLRNALIDFQGLDFNDEEDEEGIYTYDKLEKSCFNYFKEDKYPFYISYFKTFIDNEDAFSSSQNIEDINNETIKYFKENDLKIVSEFICTSFD